MSGLVGHLGTADRPPEERRLEAMAAALPHRAGKGVVRVRLGPFAGAVLASRPEDRPWASADGRLAVVADARLYGRADLYRRLARELEEDLALPGPPGGVPDAALLAAGWRRWGSELPDHLDGDFAFALWDQEQRLLLLARDCAGARPLVWWTVEGGVGFASEPAPWRATAPAGAAPAVDERAVVDFLSLDFRPSGRTLHAGVARLAPGHRLVLRQGGEARPERWWHPERAPSPGARTAGDWEDAFRERLQRAAVGRLGRVGGAPSVLLSGGLDSSAVAAVLAPGGRRPAGSAGGDAGGGLPGPRSPHLLTHVFPSFPECDESAFATAVADHLGLPLHRVSAERDLVPLAVEDLAAPATGGGAVPWEPWMAAQERLVGPLLDLAAGLGSTALFTGLGGDALFDAARWRYRDDVRRGRWWRLAPWIAQRHRRGASWPRAVGAVLVKPLLPAALLRALDRWLPAGEGAWRRRHLPPWVPADLARRTGAADRLAGRGGRDGSGSGDGVPAPFRGVRGVQYAHLVGLAQQAGTVDALEVCAARRGLEVFHPLMDRRVAELVLAAPLELGAVPRPAGSKRLLRRALGERLPRSVGERDGKAGWGPYLAHLLRGEAGRRAAELLRDGEAAAAGLVDGAVLGRELERFRRGAGPWGHGQWFLPPLLLELWLRSGATSAEGGGPFPGSRGTVG